MFFMIQDFKFFSRRVSRATCMKLPSPTHQVHVEGVWDKKTSFLLGLVRRDCPRNFNSAHVSKLEICAFQLSVLLLGVRFATVLGCTFLSSAATEPLRLLPPAMWATGSAPSLAAFSVQKAQTSFCRGCEGHESLKRRTETARDSMIGLTRWNLGLAGDLPTTVASSRSTTAR